MASALVKGAPSCQVTFLRRWKVKVRQLSFQLQVLVVADQPAVDQLIDVTGCRIRREDGQQVARFPDRGFDKGITVNRLGSLTFSRDDDVLLVTGTQQQQGGCKSDYQTIHSNAFRYNGVK